MSSRRFRGRSAQKKNASAGATIFSPAASRFLFFFWSEQSYPVSSAQAPVVVTACTKHHGSAALRTPAPWFGLAPWPSHGTDEPRVARSHSGKDPTCRCRTGAQPEGCFDSFISKVDRQPWPSSLVAVARSNKVACQGARHVRAGK